MERFRLSGTSGPPETKFGKDIKMTDSFVTLLLSLLRLAAGGVIGFLFGSIQNAALVRNRKRQESGTLGQGWAIMPGSFGRIAVLLVVLVAVQVCCPVLFNGRAEWLVSAGVLLGYGWAMMRRPQSEARERS